MQNYRIHPQRNQKQSYIPPPRISHQANAFFSTSTPQTLPTDNHWYSDDEIMILLRHYLNGSPGVTILTPMLGTDTAIQNTLQVNLEQYNIQRMQAIAEGKEEIADKVLVPINLNQNHWVLLYITYPRDAAQSCLLYYFDPLGHLPPEPLIKTLKYHHLFPHGEIIPLNHEKIQSDPYNCGPWIVQAARNLIDQGGIVSIGHEINIARSEHQELLAAFNFVDEYKTSY